MVELLLCVLFKIVSLSHTWIERYTSKTRSGPVKFLPFGLILKLGQLDGYEEARTIRFIAASTVIPVPRVVTSATGLWNNYCLMKRIDGELLLFEWSRLRPAARANIVRQLKDFMGQLRALRPPYESAYQISALDGAPIMDARAANGAFGPFTTEREFNDYLIEAALPFVDPSILPAIRAEMSDTHRIFFTHNDFSPRNVLVHGEKVVAIVDWEHSGWFPEHWEYVKAFYCHELDESWAKALEEILPQTYPQELLVDRKLSDRMPAAF